MAYGKGFHNSSNGGVNYRGRSYAVVLILALGVALIGVMVLHKLRERRIYNLLLKEKDRHLLSLHLLLQKERDYSKEMKMKNEEMKAEIYGLKSQKMELERRVLEMQSTMDSLKDEQKVMESAFEEKQNEIRMLQGEKLNLGKENPELLALTESLKKKEAEIEALKHRFQVSVDKSHWLSSDAASSSLSENLSANERMKAEDLKTETDTKEKDENLHEHNQHGNGKDSIKNEDGETRIGVEDEIRDREGNNDILVETSQQHIKRPETSPVDSKNNGEKITDREQRGKNGGAIEIDSKMVNGKQNETEEKPGQLENNMEGRGENLSASQLGDNSRFAANMKGKYSNRLGRTKGKRWRMIMNNRLLQNIGVSNSQRAENMIHLKDRTRRAFSDDENNVKREEGGMSDDKSSKDETETKLLKVESPEDRNKRVDNTNKQVTNNRSINTHPRKKRLDEVRQPENQEESGIQLSWSTRHNIVDKKEEAKSSTFLGEHQEPDELKFADAEEQEKDVIDGDDNEDNNDDFFKESQTDFEDEKEDYKEEID